MNRSTYFKFCLYSLFWISTCSCLEPVIIIHGGAGPNTVDSCVPNKLIGMKEAVKIGYEKLLQNGSALDAVEAAVMALEKNEHFNAGLGSILNIKGQIEMEASIMNGADLNAGAVTMIKDFLHPVSIARKVLSDSPHILLGGDGAKIFALEHGFHPVPQETLLTNSAIENLDEYLETHNLKEAKDVTVSKATSTNENKNNIFKGSFGTVGAVAIDTNGHIASAGSTGGMTGKAVGRIGGTPMIGCGIYADDNIGGISLTGHGESITKYCLAQAIIKLMAQGLDADNATKNAVNAMFKRFGQPSGAITLSNSGDMGIHFTTKRMPWAYIKRNKLIYGIEKDQIFED